MTISMCEFYFIEKQPSYNKEVIKNEYQTMPEQTNGISMLPTWLGNNQLQLKHEFLFFGYTDKNNTIKNQAVRIADWKVLGDRNKLDREDQDTALVAEWTIELYNLTNDVDEKINIADQHPDFVKEAVRILNEEQIDLNIVLSKRKKS